MRPASYLYAVFSSAQTRRMRQAQAAIDSTWRRWNGVEGRNSSSSSVESWRKRSAGSVGRTMISLSRPCFMPLREERALPSGVLGPPDLAPFSREERIRRSEDIGDFPPGRILVREVEAGRRGFWRNDLNSMGWREWNGCDRNGRPILSVILGSPSAGQRRA